MKRTATLFLLCMPFLGSAQECANGRYTDPAHFPDVTVTTAVPFGANTGVSGGNQVLRMDVYEPTNDMLDARPVVLVAVGGGFISGTRGDVADICEAFARMGYVAVAPDYRVGFFLPNATTTTRAVMRGAHDMRACVRYLRKTVAEDGNPYRIDPERIIIGGVSAGAISAIHATYLNEESEIPAVLIPESAAMGGIEGNSGTPGYSSEVLACYSFSGAIGDTTWIVPGDKPLASIHEVGDGVVPYYTQEVSVVGIPTGLIASGSHDIHLRFNNIGVPNCFLSYPGNGHVGYLQSDAANAIAFVAQFMADMVCGAPLACANTLAVDELTEPAASLPYPNPSADRVWLDLPTGAWATLSDLQGRVLQTVRATTDRVEFDLSGLANGVYVLHSTVHPHGVQVVKVDY
jgi:para-nitrobenzyl esterase